MTQTKGLPGLTRGEGSYIIISCSQVHKQREKQKMKSYDESITPICDECKSLDVRLKQCHRCDRVYCKHFSSLLEPDKYCLDCMKDVNVKRFFIVKRVELRHEVTEAFIARNVGKGLEMYLEGEDYIYSVHRISTLSSEEEWDRAISYHDTMRSNLIRSRENWRAAKRDKERSVKILHSTSQQPQQQQQKRKVSSVQIVQPDQQRIVLAAALMQVYKRPPTEQEIDAAVTAMNAMRTGR